MAPVNTYASDSRAFSVAQTVKSACSVGGQGLSLGWKIPGEEHGSLKMSLPERIHMDRGGWWAELMGVTESDTT